MSMLGYDAITIGNHDFDNGIDGLDKQFHAKFDIISSNYDFKNTILESKSVIIKFTINQVSKLEFLD